MTRALIVGGGIGGLTAALALARQGIQVEVFERASAFTELGAGIQLSPNCARVFDHLGLGADLAAVAVAPEAGEMRAWDTGQLLMRTEFGARLRQQTGHSYYHVHRGDLIAMLVKAAGQQRNITLHTNAPVSEINGTQDAVSIRVNENTCSGDFLIGADGIHSIVRQHLFGADQARFTGNIAWRALIPSDRLPVNLITPTATAWWGPGKHFVHYYVRQRKLVNCVCVVEKSGWENESWSSRGEHAELKQDFKDWHPTVTTLIEHMDPDVCFKWALFDRPAMPEWGRGRITLLGDACHPTLPFLAQGAAMAIEDAAILANTLDTAAIAPSLQRYASLRRARTKKIQRVSRRNASIFHLKGIAAGARNLALRLGPTPSLDWLYQFDPLSVK